MESKCLKSVIMCVLILRIILEVKGKIELLQEQPSKKLPQRMFCLGQHQGMAQRVIHHVEPSSRPATPNWVPVGAQGHVTHSL